MFRNHNNIILPYHLPALAAKCILLLLCMALSMPLCHHTNVLAFTHASSSLPSSSCCRVPTTIQDPQTQLAFNACTTTLQSSESLSPSEDDNKDIPTTTSTTTTSTTSETCPFQDYPVHFTLDEQVLGEITAHTKLVGSIDQGTSSTRFIVFTDKARILASAQVEQTQYYPSQNVGWHEHDGLELWHRAVTCMETMATQLELLQQRDNNKVPVKQFLLSGIGITNQRETLLAWNAATGQVYHRAIVWDDVRTSGIARRLANTKIDRYRQQTGLPLASYFAGTKVRWLIDNVAPLRRDLQDETKRRDVRFGTMDTWLLYQLTGTSKATATATNDNAANVGGIFCTDVSNASRWLLLDIHKVQWDPKLVRQVCGMDLPLECLPRVCPSSHIFGHVTPTAVPGMAGIPVAAVLGDQQAALFGQCAFQPGEAKNTYGTGMFLMMNTGTKIVPSKAGLLTTVAYQIGESGKVHYALEGSVSHCGSVIQWLRDQLNLIETAKESDELALQTTKGNDGLYFVPAFAGLFAPYWRSDARACIVGMTTTHHKGHICRAALEAAAYQAREVFDAIYSDSNVPLDTLRVDGGGTQSQLLMQFQADILGVPVEKPLIMETTALGAAFAAGLATGVWKDLDEIQKFWQVSQTYQPQMAAEEREQLWDGWKKAVERSLGWVEPETLAGSLRRRTIFSILRIRLKLARRRFRRNVRNLFGNKNKG